MDFGSGFVSHRCLCALHAMRCAPALRTVMSHDAPLDAPMGGDLCASLGIVAELSLSRTGTDKDAPPDLHVPPAAQPSLQGPGPGPALLSPLASRQLACCEQVALAAERVRNQACEKMINSLQRDLGKLSVSKKSS